MKKGLIAVIMCTSIIATSFVYATGNIDIYNEPQNINVYEEESPMVFSVLPVDEENTEQIVNFNSNALKQEIINNGYDSNGDGELSENEMLQLSYLDIYYNSDITDLTGLEYAKNLYHLALYGCNITDISVLAELTNLEELDLGENKISDLSPIKQLTKLTRLDIRNNGISSIAALNGHESLEFIIADENNISDISVLSSIPNIKRISFVLNNIEDISVLANISNMESICLNANKIEDISALSHITNIEDIDLSNNKIKDITALKNLKKCVVLNLSDNQITDVRAIANVQFNSLILSGNNIDVNKIVTLYAPKSIALDANNITNIDGLLDKLYSYYVSLGDNNITDITPVKTAKRLPIYTLNLMNNKINVYSKESKEAISYLREKLVDGVYLDGQRPEDGIIGDVNGDLTINNNDATYLYRYVNGWEGYTVNVQTSDVNSDGVVDTKDYDILKAYLKGEIETLPVIYQFGDINGDGQINNVDLNYFGNYLNGKEGYTVIESIADLNGDYLVDWIDYKILKRYLTEGSKLPYFHESGDVNRDFVVDIADINYLGKYLNGNTDLLIIKKFTDVNEDGLIDWNDYKMIKKRVNEEGYWLPSEYVRGDVNRDEKVDIADVNYLGKYLNGRDDLLILEKLTDINYDEVIDWEDYKLLKKYVAGEYEELKFSYAVGDLNRDFVVDAKDLNMLGKYLNNNSSYEIVKKLADTNIDGVIDWADYRLLKKYLAEETGFEVIPMENEVGDVNKDFVVDEKDVNYLYKYLKGTPGYETTERLADINKDGFVDMEDYEVFKKQFVKEDEEDPKPPVELQKTEYIIGENIELGTYKVVPIVSGEPVVLREYIPPEIAAGMGHGYYLTINNNGYIELTDQYAGVIVTNATLEKIDLNTIETNIQTTVSNGMYLVGKDLLPGTYKVTSEAGKAAHVDAAGELTPVPFNLFVSEYIQNGYVEIPENAVFVNIFNGTLEKVDKVDLPVNIKNKVSDGMYYIGKDIAPGIYKMTETATGDFDNVFYNVILYGADENGNNYERYLEFTNGYIEITENDTHINLVNVTIEKTTLDNISVNLKTTISEDGSYLVGKDIAPGIYKFERKEVDDYYVGHINKYMDLKYNWSSSSNWSAFGYVEIKEDDVLIELVDVILTKVDYDNIPVNIKDTVTDGVHLVGKDIAPGIYKFTATHEKNTATIQKFREEYISTMEGYNYITGSLESDNYGYIEITEEDCIISIEYGKLERIDIDSIPVDIKTTLKDGMYLVGKHLEKGTYKVTANGHVLLDRVLLIKDLGCAEENREEIYDIQGESYIEVTEDVVAVILYGDATITKFDISTIPVDIKTTLTAGTYLVGKHIAPGVYKMQSDNEDYCYVNTYSHINTSYNNETQNAYYNNGYIEIKDTDVTVVVNNGTITKIDLDNMPVDIKTTLDNGLYMQGIDFTPGIYKVEGEYDNSDCYVETYSSMDTSNWENQLQWYAEQHGYIELTEQDKFVSIRDGKITKVDIDNLPVNLKTTIDKNGVYIVGKDIAAGTYKITKSENIWSEVKTLSSISTNDTINSFASTEDTIIEITDTDFAVYIPYGITIQKQ